MLPGDPVLISLQVGWSDRPEAPALGHVQVAHVPDSAGQHIASVVTPSRQVHVPETSLMVKAMATAEKSLENILQEGRTWRGAALGLRSAGREGGDARAAGGGSGGGGGGGGGQRAAGGSG